LFPDWVMGVRVCVCVFVCLCVFVCCALNGCHEPTEVTLVSRLCHGCACVCALCVEWMPWADRGNTCFPIVPWVCVCCALNGCHEPTEVTLVSDYVMLTFMTFLPQRIKASDCDLVARACASRCRVDLQTGILFVSLS